MAFFFVFFPPYEKVVFLGDFFCRFFFFCLRLELTPATCRCETKTCEIKPLPLSAVHRAVSRCWNQVIQSIRNMQIKPLMIRLALWMIHFDNFALWSKIVCAPKQQGSVWRRREKREGVSKKMTRKERIIGTSFEVRVCVCMFIIKQNALKASDKDGR